MTRTVGLLADDLRSVAGDVRFDDGTRALYATDASNYRQVPIGAVLPRDADEVVRVVEVCRAHDVPLLARGGGTSLAGQCCNAAVVLDFSRYMHRILEVDPDARRARVQPGVVLDALRSEAERHRLTFGPDPATHNRCTLGGMIGNNSCGVHSVMAGKTVDNVEEMEILTYDGIRIRVGATDEQEMQRIIAAGGRRADIYGRMRALRDATAPLVRAHYPDIPRRVSGYNLDELLPERGFHVARALVGSEGTLATVLEATLRLVPSPPHRVLAVLGYPDVFHAGDHVPRILTYGPLGLEGIDDLLVGLMLEKHMREQNIRLLPEGKGWLLVEFGGDTVEEARDRARAMIDEVSRGDGPTAQVYETREEQHQIWKIRESGLGATAIMPSGEGAWPGWEDSAVHPDRVGDYLRALQGLYDRYGFHASLYGHFGQGCIHTRINFELTTPEGIQRYRAFVEEASDLVVSMGGSLSGEHGDGQARGELLPKMFGKELVDAFVELKSVWDPRRKMNPGKVVDPFLLDENLRLGAGFRPARPATYFRFPDDEGSFGKATMRCVGVGECRRTDKGTMCPSYMVTLEEQHSTRGRAHLLFEMMHGGAVKGGWRDERVREALDLCLACKGCKGDCPVNVDVATYKAEFFSHYYARRLRPRSAYALGLIYWWSRIAARMPRLVNAVAHSRALASVVKRLAGIAEQREVPRYAPETFTSWFARRGERNAGKPRVMLWPDTFNNHFHPQIARAATEVLEAAGYQVVLPSRILCCGRPLYDYGMLTLAKRQLRQIMDALQPAIADDLSIVGLEPSCVAVFRDELPALFPDAPAAFELSARVVTLAEFLMQRADGYEPPALDARVLVHGHCHHKSVLGMDADRRLLEATGCDYEILDSGCCGMAGSFGYETDRYEVSMAAGERRLLPAVRDASPDTIVMSDGFSCRQQIEQATGGRGLHLAEVLRVAIRRREDG